MLLSQSVHVGSDPGSDVVLAILLVVRRKAVLSPTGFYTTELTIQTWGGASLLY